MKLPFNIQQFLELFREYNLCVFPVQILLYVLAGVIIYLSAKKRVWSDRGINLILSFFWLWMGVVYHIVFFSSINKAAYLFGVLFIVEGILFFYVGAISRKLNYRIKLTMRGLAGAILVIFALVIYPLLGYFFGHVYPMSPSFGLPCPTTIFTLGCILWTEGKIPISVLIIPIFWSIIGFSAALQLGMKEDFSLLISAVAVSIISLLKKQGPRGDAVG